mgnify:CR=1 FL=1
MITKISKLKNFGIFYDFSWGSGLPEFKRFNLIYGWNRSGKTTISRVFESCEKKCTYDERSFKQYPKDAEFEVSIDGSLTLRSSGVTGSTVQVKVFNQDFIEENVSFDPSDPCNPIVYVSEEAIEDKARLNLLRQDVKLLDKKYDLAKTTKDAATRVEDTFRISVAQTITQLLTDKRNRDRYYSYDKAKVKEKISKFGINGFADKILDPKVAQDLEVLVKSEAKNQQPLLEMVPVSPKDSLIGTFGGDFSRLFKTIKELLVRKVNAELLKRLIDPGSFDGNLDEELNNWVKQGFEMHKSKNQFDKCLFCESQLNGSFFAALAKHYSKDYIELQESINSCISDLKAWYADKIPDQNIHLYADLASEYVVLANEYNSIVDDQHKWLDHAQMWLEQKSNNPFNSDIPEMVEAPDNYIEKINAIIIELNSIVSKHNQRVDNHNQEVSDAKGELELHNIGIALSVQDYTKYSQDLKESIVGEEKAKKALADCNQEISELEKKTSNIGGAVRKINAHLKDFFGREEIILELNEAKNGYTIRRDGQLAKNLSEGEKTAIAFSYFIVKVEEKDFKIEESIIFIDDPISSFDSNFIYHCFSLISTHFRDVGQLFISTHNFQIFNLAKEWLIKKNRKVQQHNEKLTREGKNAKPMPCELYMIENFVESDKRRAKLSALDSTLRDYKSEYHFLFSLLVKSTGADMNYEDFYTIGNVARRFFDIFADFKIPDSRDQKQKMEEIVKQLNMNVDVVDRISDADWDKTYKLINEFSHNSEPASAIEHKDKSECKDAVRILLDIVKKSDSKHYSILEKSLV